MPTSAERAPQSPIKHNRTGTKAAAERTATMVEASKRAKPSMSGDRSVLDRARAIYIKASHLPGTMPHPTAEVTVPEYVLDGFGARLACERMALRLCDALLTKLEQRGGYPGGPTKRRLTELRQQKHEHFMLLTSIIEELGGDPTALTPMGNAASTERQGVVQVITDPRTSLAAALHAFMLAELGNAESWSELLDMAQQVGLADETRSLPLAAQHAEEHVDIVRQWLRAYARSQLVP